LGARCPTFPVERAHRLIWICHAFVNQFIPDSRELRRLGLIMADQRRIMVPVELMNLRMLHCAVSAEGYYRRVGNAAHETSARYFLGLGIAGKSRSRAE
jgi:hypothetical protein